MNRRRLLSVALALPFALSGCATIDSEALRVTVTSVSIVETTLLEQRYLLRVRLQNPGDRRSACSIARTTTLLKYGMQIPQVHRGWILRGIRSDNCRVWLRTDI